MSFPFQCNYVFNKQKILKKFTKLAVGIVTIYISEKQSKDIKIEKHFKALAKQEHTSAIADDIKATGYNIKRDHFEILASSKTDYHCKIKKHCL